MMTKQWRNFDRSMGLERALGTLERALADARRASVGAREAAWRGVAERGALVDELFRTAERGVDAVCGLLDPAAAPAGDRGALAAALQADLEPALAACGLRRAPAGTWEADYLALEYMLGREPERVFGLFEAVVRDHLRPRLARVAA